MIKEYYNLKEGGPEKLYPFSSNKGKGTQNDPLIIGPTDSLPQDLQINNSSYHLQFKGCSFSFLIMKRCQNISFINCTIDRLRLEKCSQFTIKEGRFSTVLFIRNCSRNQIENCSIKRLDIVNSYENLIKDSIIDETINTASSGNIFQSLQIPEEQVKYLLTNKFTTRIIAMLTPLIVITMLAGARRIWNINTTAFFLLISAVGLILFVNAGFSLSMYRKMKKHGPNKMLN